MPDTINPTTPPLYGRKKIYTDEIKVTRKNVLEILHDTMPPHEVNRSKMMILWNYYRGKMPIIYKKKEFRENINNIVCENRAMQISEFYQGYIFGEPIQYTRNGDESLNEEIEWLNRSMLAKRKIYLDDCLAEYLLNLGVGVRMITPDPEKVYNIYTLNPMNSYNVYMKTPGEDVLCGVTYTTLDNGTKRIFVYSDTHVFVVEDDSVKMSKHFIGEVPIIEYQLNNVRMGIYEPVLTIIDAINNLQSNRLDDIQQTVNSILTIIGAELSDETWEKLSKIGGLELPGGTDAKYINSAMSQSDIEILKEDLMAAMTEVTGIPNRNGGSSTSDTGSAVLLRDGWEIADAKAKKIENQFKGSEYKMLKCISNIAAVNAGVVFNPEDVEIKFTRRNYEGIQSKSQVLTTLHNDPYVHPEDAWKISGIAPDPLMAYKRGMEWYDSKQAATEAAEETIEIAGGETAEEVTEEVVDA